MRKFSEVPSLQPTSVRAGDSKESLGWACRPGDEKKEWSCGLVGPDPRGETHVVKDTAEEEAEENWSETTDITDQDEKRFRGLMSALPSDPWALHCGKREEYVGTDFLLSPADRAMRDKAPIEVRSNWGELQGGEVATFTGNAEVTHGDQKLTGDLVSRNAYSDTMTAHGNVGYLEKGLTFASDSGFLDLGEDQGVLRNSQFILSTVPARGTSRVTYFDSKQLSRYEQFSYTSCPPGNRDWIMHADKVSIDKNSGRGSGNHAWMEFKGVPFFYTPYISFPVDDRRQTGMLAPSFGYSQVRGFDLTVPYYFNIAPNFDATVWPRLLTERGVLLHGEFRYLTPYNQGRLIAEVLPNDWQTHTTRGEAGLLDNAWLTENFRTHLDLNYVSDTNYLNQLSNQLALIDFNFVRSNATATYTGSNWGVTTGMDYFQTINPLITPTGRPYFRLPSVSGYYGDVIGDTGFSYTGAAELVNFASEENPEGQRFALKPRLQYPIRSAAGFLTPSLSFQLTQYNMSNLVNQSDPNRFTYQNNQVVDSSLTRALPVFSVDSGLFLERDVELGNTPYTHTIEPRLYYVYIPYQNQNNFPVFDSVNYYFDYYQLFRENRFTGSDRLGDANQLTTAVTSRLADQTTGNDRLRATVGEIFYFEPRRVVLPGFTQQSALLSNVVGDFGAALTDRWWLNVVGQWNPYSNQFQRRQVTLNYNDHNNHVVNLTYLYMNQPDNQLYTVDLLDGSARIKIAEGWHAIGRWQYSLLDQITLEAFAGLERETCCWRLSVVGRHYINSVTTTGSGTASNNFKSNANNGVFVQLELKGLTRLGDQLEKLLYRSIRGYRIPE
ncbi:MAG: LPS assembly protein LptD [Methylotetracoccus sp.]